MKKLTLILILFSLTGCATFKTVGIFENSGETLTGTVSQNLVGGGGDFHITTERGVTCTGEAGRPDRHPNGSSCVGQEGGGQATCTDGRSLSMRWRATSCNGGYGEVTMNDGEKVRFVFTNNETELNAAANQFKSHYETVQGDKKKVQQTQTYQPKPIESGGGYDPKTPTPTQQPNTTTTGFSIDDAKAKCADLGFKPMTEKFGGCVLRLTK